MWKLAILTALAIALITGACDYLSRPQAAEATHGPVRVPISNSADLAYRAHAAYASGTDADLDAFRYEFGIRLDLSRPCPCGCSGRPTRLDASNSYLAD